MKVSVIIPTMNEENAIAEVIRRTKKAVKGAEIIIVDNSTDRTREIAIKEKVKVIEQERKGFGDSIMVGLKNAKNDCIIMIDGDLTYWPEDISKLVKEIEDGSDLVIGNRFANPDPGSIKLLNRIGNFIISGSLKLMFGIKMLDSQTGLRAIRKSKLRDILLLEQYYGFYSEMLIESKLANLRISEVPIRFSPRVGVTKLNPIRDGFIILLVSLRFLRDEHALIYFCLPGILLMLASAFGLSLPLLGLGFLTFMIGLVLDSERRTRYMLKEVINQVRGF